MGAQGPVRLLTFSTLFPHRGRPTHGVFVENRLRHLLATAEATARVIAPVPWFPSRHERFGDWARHAQAERTEHRDGLEVHHPRYLLPPRVGMIVAPAALFAASAGMVRRLRADGTGFDLIDGHYVYPDGVAAVALGRLVGRPVVLTARGSDVTQYPSYREPRRMIRWAMRHAAGLVAVSEGLKDAMVALGAPPEKVTVLRNGVDLDLFQRQPDADLRNAWRARGPVLLSVGHLIERKRQSLVIEALRSLPDWTLVLVGEGPDRGGLAELANRLGVGERVVFAGPQPHSALARYYSSADVSILASSREGWANVLLESMACGTPVVASNIPGNPEVVRAPEAGIIAVENTAQGFAAAVSSLYARKPPPASTRAYAERFGWEPTSRGQLDLFRAVLSRG